MKLDLPTNIEVISEFEERGRSRVCIDADSSAYLIHPYIARVHFTKYDGTPEGKVLYRKEWYQVQWQNMARDLRRKETYRSSISSFGYAVASLIAAKLNFIDYALGFAFFGAVAFDAGSQARDGTGTTVTWSHTCTGSDRVIVVGVVADEEAASSVTYAGAALSNYANGPNVTGADSELWYKAAPATGANNVVVTIGVSDEKIGMAVSFTGSDGTLGTAATGSGNGTAATITVSGAAGDMIVDVLAVNTDNTVTVDASQTERATLSSGNGEVAKMSTEAGGASVAMDWTWTGNSNWSQVGVAVKAGTQFIETYSVSVNDAITVTESVSMNVVSFINVNDAVTVAESVSSSVILNITVSDAVSVSEFLNMDRETVWTDRSSVSATWTDRSTINNTFTTRTRPTSSWTKR